MDVLVKLTVPNYIYKFYDSAAEFIADTSAEDLMADTLTAYAGMISKDVAKERQQASSAEEPT